MRFSDPVIKTRLAGSTLLVALLFTLVCAINLVSFHTRHTVYLEKQFYYNAHKRSILAQNLFNAVSEVQQQLTDISATLGLDQLDQGFERAGQAVEVFHTSLNNLQRILPEQTDDTPAPIDPQTLRNRFDRFYALGVAMANAYMSSGTLSGNQKMLPFDTEADTLRESLARLLALQEQQAEYWHERLQRHQAEDFDVPSGISSLLWRHLMGGETRAHYIRFMTHLVTSAPHDDRRMALSRSAQELQGLMIHVQQWLTDLAATRGQDGLDEGVEQAYIGAQKFQSALPDFLAMVERTGEPDQKAAMTGLGERFERFHALGQVMARAYIHGGAKEGNPLMRKFDQMSDELQRSLQPFVTPSVEAAFAEDFQMELVHHSLRDVRKALFFLLFLSLIASAGGFTWLASCKTTP